MTDTCGRRCYELFASYPRHTSWARTYLDCFLSTGVWYSRLCALTWSVKDTTYSRSIIRLRALVPRTSEIECSSSLIGTPTAKANQLAPSMQKWPSCRVMMPTPTASDHIERKSTSTEAVNPLTGKSVSLDRFVRFWPDQETQTSGIPAMWPTPNTADGTGGPGNSGRAGGENLRTAVNGSLNPTFVEYLMNFPAGWTEV